MITTYTHSKHIYIGNVSVHLSMREPHMFFRGFAFSPSTPNKWLVPLSQQHIDRFSYPKKATTNNRTSINIYYNTQKQTNITNTQTKKHTNERTNERANKQTSKKASKQTNKQTHVFHALHTHNTHTHIYIYIYISMGIHIYIYMYI